MDLDYDCQLRYFWCDDYRIKIVRYLTGEHVFDDKLLHLSKIITAFMLDLSQSLIVRVVITTAIFSIISYFVVRKNVVSPDRLKWAIPSLFAVFGISILIQILYVLQENNL